MFVEYIIPKPMTLSSNSANKTISIATPRCPLVLREFMCSPPLLTAGLETFCRLITVVQPDRRDQGRDGLDVRLRVNRGRLQSQRRLYRVDTRHRYVVATDVLGQSDGRAAVECRENIEVLNALHFDLILS